MAALKEEDVTIILAAYGVSRTKRERALARVESAARQLREAEKELAREEGYFASARIVLMALNDDTDMEVRVMKHRNMDGPGWEVSFVADNCRYSLWVSEKKIAEFKEATEKVA